MPRLVLISNWTLAAGSERVWSLLTAVDDWPGWWPHLRESRRLSIGDAAGVGEATHFVWRSGLGYRLGITMTTVRVAHGREIEAVADGDVAGRGLWVLEPVATDRMRLTYRWEVALRRPWMRLLAPLLAPVFSRRHFAVMRAGAAGMAERLGCSLSDYRDWSGRPLPAGTSAPAAPDTVTHG